MRPGRSALLVILALAACAPKAGSPAPRAFTLDCALGFEGLTAKITAQPGLHPAPKETGEPYSFYSSQNGSASWLVTEPGAPGHPAILMQQAAAGKVATTGCPYGDQAGYEQLLAYLDSLKRARPR